jgi:predicted ABC-type ATPase
MSAPRIIILAGPNGAEKTTSSRALLADTLSVTTYVNADTIAQGLSGFSPESSALEAGRIMLCRLRELGREGVDFSFETTLAARTFVKWLRELQQAGSQIGLFTSGWRVPS